MSSIKGICMKTSRYAQTGGYAAARPRVDTQSHRYTNIIDIYSFLINSLKIVPTALALLFGNLF